MITSEQCRAARALLNWSQGDLANEAGVGVVTVRQLEAAVHVPRRATSRLFGVPLSRRASSSSRRTAADRVSDYKGGNRKRVRGGKRQRG